MTMFHLIDAGQPHAVDDANFNRHRPGELHPDRVMALHDIVYLLEGGWEIGQEGERHTLGQGDVIFLQAGCHHYGMNGHLPGCRTMYLHILPAPGDRCAFDGAALPPGPAGLMIPTVVSGRGSVEVRRLFEELIASFWSDGPQKEIRLAALVNLLLYELAALSRAGGAPGDGLVDGVLGLIRLTPGRTFPLAELAERFHVCSRALTDRFARATGKTIHRYQIDLKLEMACAQIRNDPRRPFKDIAGNLGFYDEFHFSRLFKAKYGFPPSEWKRRSGAGQALLPLGPAAIEPERQAADKPADAHDGQRRDDSCGLQHRIGREGRYGQA